MLEKPLVDSQFGQISFPERLGFIRPADTTCSSGMSSPVMHLQR